MRRLPSGGGQTAADQRGEAAGRCVFHGGEPQTGKHCSGGFGTCQKERPQCRDSGYGGPAAYR